MTEAVADRDGARVIELLDELYNNACSMDRLLLDLLAHFRNLMLARSVPNYGDLIVCQKSELAAIHAQAERFTLARILNAMDILQEAAGRLKGGANARTAAEMTLLRLADQSLDTDIHALTARIAELERRLDTGAFKSPAKAAAASAAPQPADPEPPRAQNSAPEKAEAPAAQVPKAQQTNHTETQAVPPASFPESAPAKASASADMPFQKWSEALERLAAIDRPLVPHMRGSSAVERGDLLLIQSDNPLLEQFLQTGSHANCIMRAVYDVTGKKYRIGIFHAPRAAAAPAVPKKDPLENLLSRAQTLGVEVVDQ